MVNREVCALMTKRRMHEPTARHRMLPIPYRVVSFCSCSSGHNRDLAGRENRDEQLEGSGGLA